MTLLDKLKCLAIKAIAYKNISFMSCRKLVTKINKHILFAVNEHFTQERTTGLLILMAGKKLEFVT